MTEFKFPDPRLIDCTALKESDVVWIKATVEQARAFYTQIVTVGTPFHGHVIKAPIPLAVGDKVRVFGNFSVYDIIALDGNTAWLRHAVNSGRPYRETVELANLVRVEP